MGMGRGVCVECKGQGGGPRDDGTHNGDRAGWERGLRCVCGGVGWRGSSSRGSFLGVHDAGSAGTPSNAACSIQYSHPWQPPPPGTPPRSQQHRGKPHMHPAPPLPPLPRLHILPTVWCVRAQFNERAPPPPPPTLPQAPRRQRHLQQGVTGWSTTAEVIAAYSAAGSYSVDRAQAAWVRGSSWAKFHRQPARGRRTSGAAQNSEWRVTASTTRSRSLDRWETLVRLMAATKLCCARGVGWG
jgi:hypothetical protein